MFVVELCALNIAYLLQERFTEVAKMLLPPLYTVQETSVELSLSLSVGKVRLAIKENSFFYGRLCP